ncbi:hypothetical protein Slala03_73870 [Streptomyces lavendulae subsp. lavendulae]|uniref:ABC transporter permease n=1 Tax=Streptomyces lavendulae TaxID=1914 RepID=UPI0024A579AA|nr:ABC transporter permease [Streptomyces lavendulae]GLV87698.1 hypothetical protein Slala03_73870 [Streptomyces lavendulae subsp. lavendulae]
MLRIAAATLRHRLAGFVGAFLALALGTTMIGMMTLTLAATFGTPHPGPQRFKEAPAVVAPQGFEGRPMKAPAVLAPEVVTRVTAAGRATPDRSFPVRLEPGPAGTTGHPWSSAAFAGYRLVAGRAPRAPDEIAVGGGAPSLIGSQARAATARDTGRYRVVGVTEALWFESAVFFADAEAQRLSPGVNALVTDQDPERLSALVGGRAAVLDGAALTRLDADSTGGAQALANAQAMAGSTTGLAVSVAVFVVIATFAFATEQRRRELALMRLVGASPRQMRRMVLGEALLIGLAAAVVGCALAPLCAVPLRSWMLDHDVAPSWFTIPVDPLPLLVSFVIDEHAARSDGLSVGDRVVTLLPTGARVPTVIAAVVARGLNGDDTYLSASLTGAMTPSRLYLDSGAGTGLPLDERQTAAVERALAGSGARLMTYAAYLEAQRAHAAEQTDNAAVVVLGIALAHALIAVANTLIMAMAGRRREFALLGLAGAVRGQIVGVAVAESAVAVAVAAVLAAVATGLTAVTQHASLSRLVTGAPTVVPWTPTVATVALCALVTVVTAARTARRATRRRAVEAAGVRE